MPVSRMEKRILPAVAKLTVKVTLPVSVNLMALLSRLIRT